MTTELTQQQQLPAANQPAEPLTAGGVGGGRKRGRQLKYNYPLYTTVRLSKQNIDKLRGYGRYADSIDDVVTKLLDRLEEFKKRGYEPNPIDGGSF